MSTRRRMLLIAGVAACVLLVAELGARGLAPYLRTPERFADTTTQTKAAQLAARAEPCTDVVFVGNSMARDALDPAAFADADPAHRSAYNASLDAATPALLDHWLGDRVLGATDPAVVVVAVSSFDLSAGNRAGASAEAAYLEAPATRPGLLGHLDVTAGERLALVEHRLELRRPEELWAALGRAVRREPLPTEQPGGTIDADGVGRSRRDLTFAPDPVHDRLVQRQLLDGLTVGPDRVEALEHVVATVHASGATPVLAVLPVTDHFRSLHPDDGWETFLDAIAGVAASTDTPLLRLDRLDLAEGSFADSHHVNAAGAVAISASLPGSLAEAGVETRRC